jgi:hypothetical protein
MIKPSLIISLLALCALLAIALLTVKSGRPVPKPSEAFGGKLFPNGLGDIKSIEIKKGNAELKLEKKDKAWILASQKNRPANGEKVNQLINDASHASIAGQRSGLPSLFKLDDANVVQVVFTSATGKKELFIGKNSEYYKTFVRTSANGEIVEVDKPLEADAGIKTENGDQRTLDLSLFYDLKLLSLAADDVLDVAIKKKDGIIRLQRVIPGKGPLEPKQEPAKDDPKPEWWITEPEGAAADDGAAGRITSMLNNLNAKGYADEVDPAKAKAHLDDPLAKIKVRLKDGSEHTLIFPMTLGDKGDVVLSVDGKPELYVVSDYVYNAFSQKLDELKKKEPPAEPGKKEPVAGQAPAIKAPAAPPAPKSAAGGKAPAVAPVPAATPVPAAPKAPVAPAPEKK